MGSNWEKYIDKSQDNSNPRVKCHACHGFGHMSFQCPSKPIVVLKKDNPSQEAVKGSKQLET